MPWPRSVTPLYLRSSPPLHRATAEQRDLITSFARDGLVTVDIDADDFNSLADQIIRELDPLYAGELRLQDAWQRVEAVRKLALLPQILIALETLHGRRPFGFQTLNFPVGTQQPTHSDIIHFNSNPANFMAGVWIALEDTDADNGPLHYYPGSHRLAPVTLDQLNHSGWPTDSWKIYTEVYEPAIQQLVADNGLVQEEAHVKKGQAIIWAANLLHGGNRILDAARSRHSQVTHYYFERCRYWTPILSGPGKIFRRYPTDIATGLQRTRLGATARAEDWLRRSFLPW